MANAAPAVGPAAPTGNNTLMTTPFTKEHSQAYDTRNAKLAPIADNMHFLIRLVLQGLPANASILCVGVGTGAEILSLAKAFPGWTFTGVDPSASMLEVCAENLEKAGISQRCQLIHGYVHNAPTGETFDAALSILVAHFVKPEDRTDFFRQMTTRLKPAGYLVNTEISADLDTPNFPALLENWKQVQTLMGATPQSLANLSQTLRTGLSILPPHQTEAILHQAGIKTPTRFFQSILIHGWYGQK